MNLDARRVQQKVMKSWIFDGRYCKTLCFWVPFISRAWQVRENNGPRKFEYSSVSV